MWRAVCLVIIKQVATVPISPTDSSDTFIAKGRYEPGVHMINNANPYQRVVVNEGHGKYPVIFEPLQNVQTSHSTYKVTSFIDFTPYLEYFQQFERYLEAFKSSINDFENDPVLQEFQEQTVRATCNIKGEACRHYPACYSQSLLYKLRTIEIQAIAYRRERECCMAQHMQACLVLRQFEYILNVTEYVNENYLWVKAKFLRAIDYVEDINVGEPTPTGSSSRPKRDSGTPFDTRVTLEETEYLIKLLTDLAAWDPTQNVTHREKRFVPLFASLGAAIGSIVNAGQIKTRKPVGFMQRCRVCDEDSGWCVCLLIMSLFSWVVFKLALCKGQVVSAFNVPSCTCREMPQMSMEGLNWGEGGWVPLEQPCQFSGPSQHKSLRDYTNITVLSGPPNPPKVEIYLRKASRRCPG